MHAATSPRLSREVQALQRLVNASIAALKSSETLRGQSTAVTSAQMESSPAGAVSNAPPVTAASPAGSAGALRVSQAASANKLGSTTSSGSNPSSMKPSELFVSGRLLPTPVPNLGGKGSVVSNLTPGGRLTVDAMIQQRKEQLQKERAALDGPGGISTNGHQNVA
jgi:hypothetical protein